MTPSGNARRSALATSVLKAARLRIGSGLEWCGDGLSPRGGAARWGVSGPPEEHHRRAHAGAPQRVSVGLDSPFLAREAPPCPGGVSPRPRLRSAAGAEARENQPPDGLG